MGLTRGGTGERIERIWREVKALTIPGGSEDVSARVRCFKRNSN